MTRTVRGTIAVLSACALFGLIFYLAGVVEASAEVVFAWRVVIMLTCYLPVFAFPAGRHAVRAYVAELRKSWVRPIVFVFLSAAVGLQVFIFGWAPSHGAALDASMGYLMLPIVLVVVGRFIFHDSISKLQWVAVGLAVCAVAYQLAVTQTIGWVTLAICVVFPIYFALRKHFALDSAIAFGAELILLTPLAVVVISTHAAPSGALSVLAVASIGVVGAVAFGAYFSASTLLPLPIFGLLGYAEPVFLFVVALALGEHLEMTDVVTYAMLIGALAILGYNGARQRSARGRLSLQGASTPLRGRTDRQFLAGSH